MQTQPNTVTWITFAIEAVKILGPAGLALAGTWIALRYQKRAKQVEIDAQIKLKARELLFEAYQRDLDKHVAELKELGGAIKTLSMKLKGGTQEEQKEAALKVGIAMSSAVLPILASPDRLEAELKEFGLADRYQPQLAYMKQVMGEVVAFEDLAGAHEMMEKQYLLVNHLTVMLQDLLDKKRHALFAEYLPK